MQGNPTYRLVVRRGPQPNQSYELTGDVTNIGRDITNDIVINDREVSRHHLRLMRGSDGYTIEDLGSTNGTFVNGKRLTGATPLKNGDMIGLGETVTLAFDVVRSGQDNATPAPDEQSESQQTVESRSEPEPQPPPAQQPASQPQPQDNPYQPQPAQPEPQPAQAYQSQQQSDDYDYGGGQQQDDYAPQGAYGPPPPGYDYDPYTMREDEGSSTTRWILFGCLGLLLFCCCISAISLVVIDALVLYCDIPVLRDILEALGLLQCAAG